MTKTAIALAAAAAATALHATPGSALDLRIGAGPAYQQDPYAFAPVVGPEIAKRAAHMVGMADIDDVDHEGPLWIVTGNDLRDRDMTVKVDARTGRVVSARLD